jgi:hypothetical protein
MMKFIFVLYCVIGCELSHPNHRMIQAYETIESCQRQKQTLEGALSLIYSCERVSLYQF